MTWNSHYYVINVIVIKKNKNKKKRNKTKAAYNVSLKVGPPELLRVLRNSFFFFFVKYILVNKNYVNNAIIMFTTMLRHFSAPRHLHETDIEGSVGLGDRDAAHVTGVGQTWRRGPSDVPVNHTWVLKREVRLSRLRRLQVIVGHR